MLKQLKRFFGRSNQAEPHGRTAAPVASHGGFKPLPPRSSEPRAVEPVAAPPTPPAAAPDFENEDISIPLQSVLNALPADLKSRVIPMDLRGATLTVTLHKILSQLPSGVVTLSFGVLRGAAPQLFSVDHEFDERDVELPLNELLVRIPPAALSRSRSQKVLANTDTLEDSFIPVEAPSSPTRSVKPQPTQGPIRVPLPTPAPAPAPARAATSPTTSAAAKPSAASPAGEAINIPLSSVASAWPAVIRSEIAQLNCANAQVALPEKLVQAGMKRGKVAFSWQAIRGWMDPSPPAVISKHDNMVLDLPLEAIMPLFVSRLKRSPKTQQRLVVDNSIPALFSPATSPEAPAPETNNGAPAPAANTSTPAPVAKTPSTDFKNRYISPTEVVTRASALEGVAGALVVLPEGLVVAARLSTNQHPDALAAFLARAIGRVNQCAEEAQVGELNYLEFSAQNIPWRIFRLHGVLFAAFGRAGGSLPIPQLAALAGEFDRKKRG